MNATTQQNSPLPMPLWFINALEAECKKVINIVPTRIPKDMEFEEKRQLDQKIMKGGVKIGMAILMVYVQEDSLIDESCLRGFFNVAEKNASQKTTPSNTFHEAEKLMQRAGIENPWLTDEGKIIRFAEICYADPRGFARNSVEWKKRLDKIFKSLKEKAVDAIQGGGETEKFAPEEKFCFSRADFSKQAGLTMA